MSTKFDKTLPYLLGVGLALLPMQRFYGLGVTGLMLILFTSCWTVYRHWRDVVHAPKIVLCFVLILALLAVAVPGSTTYAKFFMLGMICVFLTGTILGPDVFVPLGISAVIGGLSVLVTIGLNDFTRSGGMYHVSNYNESTGVILLGTIFWRHRYQWLLLPVAVAGALATGADEALVIIAMLGAAVILRRDISWKVLSTVALITIPFITLAFPNSPTKNLWATIPATYHTVFHNEASAKVGVQYEVEADLNNRLRIVVDSFKDVRLFGHGYQPDNVLTTTIHSVPVRLLWELGPLAVLCWIGLIVYGIWKTSWKYAFVALVAASLFDHYPWTQLAPYFFVLLGVCSWSSKESDRIFTHAKTIH